jgi:solute carrier family 25 aspartate/glutamate transporter 12/13
MEASIIFHFAGRGVPGQRLALVDFAQLLDPRWKAPYSHYAEDSIPATVPKSTSYLLGAAHSAYSFVQGGIAGAFGATIVYPIDMVKTRCVGRLCCVKKNAKVVQNAKSALDRRWPDAVQEQL